MATKAEQIWDEINALVESGTAKADAFKQLAEEYGQPVDSIRGSYYSHKKKIEGGEPNARPSRTRRRETTPDDALADARAALERAIASIDREVEVAKTRADEAKAEHEALKASAAERKKAISERLEALK
jgi:chromosome segregation ATPase